MTSPAFPFRRAGLRPILLGSVALIALASAGQALANPTGGTVVAGTGGGTTIDNSSTPNTVNVNQLDTRVVIDWTTFDISSTETVNFNQTNPGAVAFNIVTGSGIQSGPPQPPPVSTIDGHLNADGGVFLFSPGGVVIGSNARIDVGSFVAATGNLDADDPSFLLYDDEDYNTTTVFIDPQATAGTASITIAAGAQISANAGIVVLQSESITQNGTISATDGVSYIVAEGGSFEVYTDNTGIYLGHTTTQSVVGRGRPAFTQGPTGSTAGLFVGLNTPNGDVEGGYHGVINLGGTVEATGIDPFSDNSVTLHAGSSTWPFGGHNNSGFILDASNATIVAAGRVHVRATNAKMGDIDTSGSPTGDVDIDVYGDLELKGDIVAGRDLGFGNEGDGLSDVSGSLYAGRDINGEITTLAGGLTVGAGHDVNLYGGDTMTLGSPITAAHDVYIENDNIDGLITISAKVIAGRDLYLFADNITTTGDLDVGRDFFVTSYGNSQILNSDIKVGRDAEFDLFGAGDVLQIGGNLDVKGDLTIYQDPDGGGFGSPPPSPSVILTGTITVGGDADFTTFLPTGEIDFHDLTVDGNLYIGAVAITSTGVSSVGGDVTLEADNFIDLDGDLHAGGGIDLSATNTVGGDGGLSATGDFTVHGGDIDFGGPITIGGDTLLSTQSNSGGHTTHLGDAFSTDGNLDIDTHVFTADSSVHAGGNLTYTTGTRATFSGAVSAGGDVDVETEGDDNLSAAVLFGDSLYAGGALTVSALTSSSTLPVLADVGFIGPVTAIGAVQLTARATDANTGNVVGGRIHIEGGLQSHQGITANSGGDIDAESLDVTGIASLTALQDIVLTGSSNTLTAATINGGTVTGSGDFHSDGNLTIRGVTLIDLSGALSADLVLSARTSGLDATLNLADVSAQDLRATLDDGGGMTIDGTVNLSRDAILYNFGANGSITIGGAWTVGRDLLVNFSPPETSGLTDPDYSLSLYGAITVGRNADFNLLDTDYESPAGTVFVYGDLDVAGNLDSRSINYSSFGALNVGGDTDVYASSSITLHDADFGGDASFFAGDGASFNGVIAVAGDLSVTTPDFTNNAQLSAGGDLGIDTTYLFGSGSIHADGAVNIDAASIQQDGAISSGDALSLTTSDYIQVGGLGSDSGLTISAGTFFKSTGPVSSGAASTITAGSNLTLDGVSDFVGDTTLTADHNSGIVTIGGAMDVQGDLTTVSYSLVTTAPITVSGDLNVDPPGDIVIGAAMDVVGDANLSGSAGIYVNANLTVGGNLGLTAGTVVNSTAAISATGDLTIDGPDGISLGGQTDGAAVALTSNGFVTIDGPLTADSLSVTADSFNSSGLITLNSGFSLTTNGPITFGPAVINGDLNLATNDVGAEATVSGALTVHGDLTLTSHGDFSNHGLVRIMGETQVDGDVTLQGGFYTDAFIGGNTNADGAWTATGLNQFWGTAGITVGQDMNVQTYGDIRMGAGNHASVAQGAMNLEADDGISIEGLTRGVTGLSLEGNAVTFDAPGALSSGGDITIDAGSGGVDGDGAITANGDLGIDTVDGTIYLGGSVNVGGDALLNVRGNPFGLVTVDGPLFVGNNLTIEVHTETESAPPIFPTGDIVLNGDVTADKGNITLSIFDQNDEDPDGYIGVFGALNAGGDLQTSSYQFDSNGNGVINITGDAEIDAINDITIGGPTTTGGDLNLYGGGFADISGALTIGGDLNVHAADGIALSSDLDPIPGNVVGGDVILETQGDISIDAPLQALGGMGLYGGDLTSGVTGPISAAKGINIEAYGVDLDGDLTSGDYLEISANNIALSGATTVTGDADLFAYDFDGDITIDGIMTVGGQTTFEVHTSSEEGDPGAPSGTITVSGQLTSAGPVRLAVYGQDDESADGAITVSGSVTTDDNLNVFGRDFTTSGALDVAGNGDVQVSHDASMGGPADIGADLTVDAGRNITLGGPSTVGGDAGLTAHGPTSLITIAGSLTVDGNLTTDSFAFHNTGAMTVGGNLSIDPGGDIVIDAPTFVGGDASLVTDDNIIINATLTVTGVLGMDATNITSSAPGIVSAGDDINAQAGGDITLGGAMSSDGDINLDADGDLILNAGVTAVGFLRGSGDNITVASGVTVQADSEGENVGGINLSAGRDFTAATTSLIVAGPSQGPATAGVFIGGGGNSGGDTTVGQVRGTNVTISEYGGDVNVNGAVSGSNSVDIYANFDLDPGIGGDVHVAANISGGSVEIYNEGGGVTVNGGVTVSGVTRTVIDATDDVTIGGTVTGGATGVFTGETLTISANGSVVSTGATTAPTWPVAPFNYQPGVEGPPTLSGLTLSAHALVLNGSVTAGPVGNRSEVFIQPVGTLGSVTVGGSGGSGFQLTNSAFGHITARNVIFLGGAGDGRGTGYDLTLSDLTMDPSKVGGLWLGTQSAHSINVTGTVTGGGAVRLGFAKIDGVSIGDTLQGGGGSTLLGYIPGEIDISGGLGTFGAPLDAVSLVARNNIFMGSSAFIGAARQDSAFDATKRSSEFSITSGHLFVSAGTLDLAAQGRIIQQNTAPAGAFSYAGIAIDTPTLANPLINPLTGLEGKAFGPRTGPAVWTAHFGAGPTAVDVFGSLDTGTLPLIADESAARQPFLLGTGMTTLPAYRINSCAFGATCVRGNDGDPGRVESPDPDNPQDPTDPNNLTQLLDEGTLAPLDATQVLPIKLDEDEDQKKNQTPITGSGNGDLWPGGPAPQ